VICLVKRATTYKTSDGQKQLSDYSNGSESSNEICDMNDMNDMNNMSEMSEAKNECVSSQITNSKHRLKFYSGTDPFELAEILKKTVCKGNMRKYYRFRGGRFYGGISAADCLGCVLDCVFCWSYKPRCNPEKVGKFYTPNEVIDKLIQIAKKNGYNKMRITGNEPTFCKEHLLDVLELVPDEYLFILETNGILLDKSYVNSLEPFKHHLHVRVSLKAVTEEQFEAITGMSGKYVDYPFRSLKYLANTGISSNAAIMNELVDESNMRVLYNKLDEIDNRFARELELENLIMYPFVAAELSRRGLNKNFKPF
jgi:uncharacterized Fe-S cluster-containing radical SAM superfamily protein